VADEEDDDEEEDEEEVEDELVEAFGALGAGLGTAWRGGATKPVAETAKGSWFGSRAL
jgi:hypothetical protein